MKTVLILATFSFISFSAHAWPGIALGSGGGGSATTPGVSDGQRDTDSSHSSESQAANDNQRDTDSSHSSESQAANDNQRDTDTVNTGCPSGGGCGGANSNKTQTADARKAETQSSNSAIDANLEQFHYSPGTFLYGDSSPNDTPNADDKGSPRLDSTGRGGGCSDCSSNNSSDRISVQFNWSRESDRLNQSLWHASLATWSGSNFGSNNLPRIGQEVITNLLGSSPD